MSNQPWLETTANGGDISSQYGYDIIFKAEDGETKLDHEIEKYDGNEGAGTLVAWVRIPILLYNASTIIYMYYGNPTVTSPTANRAAVWDTNHKGVWDLQETSGRYVDSTSNNNAGTASVTSRTATARIGTNAPQFSPAADNINCGTGSSLDFSGNMTLEAWIYPTDWGEGGFGSIVERGAEPSDGYQFYIRSSTTTVSGLKRRCGRSDSRELIK